MILLIDRHGVVEQEVHRALGQQYHLVTAASRSAALKTVRTVQIRLVLLVLEDAETRGGGMLRMLRSLDAELPVIVIAVKPVSVHSLAEMSLHGVRSIFVAPPHDAELRQAVDRALTGGGRCTGNELPLDTELLIRSEVEEALRAHRCLQNALQSFQDKYSELISSKGGNTRLLP